MRVRRRAALVVVVAALVAVFAADLTAQKEESSGNFPPHFLSGTIQVEQRGSSTIGGVETTLHRVVIFTIGPEGAISAAEKESGVSVGAGGESRWDGHWSGKLGSDAVCLVRGVPASDTVNGRPWNGAFVIDTVIQHPGRNWINWTQTDYSAKGAKTTRGRRGSVSAC
jgi:hypothetical protein